MKSLSSVSMYDLMAEDLDVWMKKQEFGFNIQIDDENGDVLVDEDNVHPYAAESFAIFCRRYLAVYEKALGK